MVELLNNPRCSFRNQGIWDFATFTSFGSGTVNGSCFFRQNPRGLIKLSVYKSILSGFEITNIGLREVAVIQYFNPFGVGSFWVVVLLFFPPDCNSGLITYGVQPHSGLVGTSLEFRLPSVRLEAIACREVWIFES